jgi:hypothetical protein
MKLIYHILNSLLLCNPPQPMMMVMLPLPWAMALLHCPFPLLPLPAWHPGSVVLLAKLQINS